MSLFLFLNPIPLFASKNLPFYTSRCRPINDPEKLGFYEFPFLKGDLAPQPRRLLRCYIAEALQTLIYWFAVAKGVFAETKCFTSLPQPTSSTFAVRLFVISTSVLFFYLLAALLIPTSPYSIEQYNMRD